MSKILIHIHSGLEQKNKVTLGLFVALSALKEGHEVKIFLAADGVHLLSIKNEGEIVGEGTGDLKKHLDQLRNNNSEFFVSGMSAKARGYDESLLEGYNANFSLPDKLINLSLESDSVLCY